MTTNNYYISALTHSTIVEGATSIGYFLSTRINNKNVGLPVYKFSYTDPDLDIVQPQTDLILNQAKLYDYAESYGAGIGMWFSNTSIYNSAVSSWSPDLSSFCIPMYRLEQDPSDVPQVTFVTPTLVSQLESTGLFVTFNINSDVYGVPLYNFSSTYPFTSSTPQSAIPITTQLLSKVPVLDGSGYGSTNLNPKVTTYAKLIKRIKTNLGWPIINLEVCDDENIVDCIDQAVEWFTKYAGFTQEFLIFKSSLYTEAGLPLDQLFSSCMTLRSSRIEGLSGGYDYDLQDYRKVVNCFSLDQGETTNINTLFTLEQAMAQQTYFSYQLGSTGFDLITWHVLKQWLEIREKVLAQKIWFDFDQRNQMLRLIPPPSRNQSYYGVIGAYVEKPIKDVIMERWVYQYALCLTKIQIAHVRSKYGNVQLIGGGSINWNDLATQGLAEKDKLEQEIMFSVGEAPILGFFIG